MNQPYLLLRNFTDESSPSQQQGGGKKQGFEHCHDALQHLHSHPLPRMILTCIFDDRVCTIDLADH
jgi:hypothetical protein